MTKETKNKSISHLFPLPLFTIGTEHRRHSCDKINQLSDKTNFHYLSSQKSTSNEITINDSSQTSTLAKFCYKRICKRCVPESVRIDPDTNQQINIDLLYAYDPFQTGVGDIMNSFTLKIS
ncbi:unnamed protein product [Rotaria sp. Silwood2]|nr:unnamed protein product [Rotaria sp. Silwood2]CAF4176799.1 unnamed protein product [Rotaria sp. Silwood2]